MNVLITGGAGYIGSQISYLLSDNKIKNTIIDNLSTGHKKLINKKSKFYKADISNKKKINLILRQNKINAVIHLAGSILVSESMDKPELYYQNNVCKFIDFLDECKKHKIKYFIFSSTCAVYDEKYKSVNEYTPLNPKSIYGKTKLYCENILKSYSKKYNFEYSILRYFNVIGADTKSRTGQINDSGHLLMNLANSFFKKNIFKVYGKNYKTKDGTAVRDFIDVEDLSLIHFEVLKKMIKLKKSFEINCGKGKGYSVLEIIKKLEGITGKNIKKIFLKRRMGDVEQIVAENKFLKKNINYKFRKDLKESITTFIKWRKKIK
tara:strand:- start:268 stop:1230 length:963 start_codon:yes stop_codon:yes gene_type:complete